MVWSACALVATFAMLLCGVVLVRGSIGTRLVALQMASATAALTALLCAQSFGDESAYDVALLIALLSFPAGIVYARFYGRWL